MAQSLQFESWRPNATDDRYEISTEGRVRHAQTKQIRALHISGGYNFVTLGDKTDRSTKKVSFLVALTFLGPPPDGQDTVDHINRIKNDDRVENLRWASIKEQRANQDRISTARVVSELREPSSEASIRDIPGFAGYRASSDGLVQIRNGTWKKETGDTHGREGYYRIDMGKHKKHDIHELVALAFLGTKPEGHKVQHINGNKQDNRADNLRYATVGEINSDIYTSGRRAGPKQKAVNQYTIDGTFVATYPNQQAAATALNKNGTSLISLSTNAPKRTKTAYGFYWVAAKDDSGDEAKDDSGEKAKAV